MDRPKVSFWQAGWEGEIAHSVVYGGPGRYRIRLNWQNDGTPSHLKSWSLVTGELPLNVLPGKRPESVREAPAEPASASSADVESVLRLLGDYGPLAAPLFADRLDTMRARGESRRAWLARCPALSPGTIDYLGHLAASHPDAGYRAVACEAIGATGNVTAAEMLMDPLGD